jgi:hypothetical protein
MDVMVPKKYGIWVVLSIMGTLLRNSMHTKAWTIERIIFHEGQRHCRCHQRCMSDHRNIYSHKNSYTGHQFALRLITMQNNNKPKRRRAMMLSTSSEVSTTGDDNKTTSVQDEINQRIYDVAKTVCNLSPNKVSITWKTSRIVVTVNTDAAFLATTIDDEGGNDDDMDIEIDIIDEDVFFGDDDDSDSNNESSEFGGTFESKAIKEEHDIALHDSGVIVDTMEVHGSGEDYKYDTMEVNVNAGEEAESTAGVVDLALLARAINNALDDDGGIGTQIAEHYDMFAAYRGFDVIVQHYDPKKKEIKQYEGRLVEKNKDHVIVNNKGRMKHFKNANVRSVKLPKFKTEKGVR